MDRETPTAGGRKAGDTTTEAGDEITQGNIYPYSEDRESHRRRYPQKATEAPCLKEAGTGEGLPHLK